MPGYCIEVTRTDGIDAPIPGRDERMFKDNVFKKRGVTRVRSFNAEEPSTYDVRVQALPQSPPEPWARARYAPPSIVRAHTSDSIQRPTDVAGDKILTVQSTFHSGVVLYVRPLTFLPNGLSSLSRSIIAGYDVSKHRAVQVVNRTVRPAEHFAVAHDRLHLAQFCSPERA